MINIFGRAGLLTAVVVAALNAGCAIQLKTKYGEPKPVTLDNLSIDVYILENSDGTYDVVSVDNNGLRIVDPLNDVRRYTLAAETVAGERCSMGKVLVTLLATSQEGVAGRFFQFACKNLPDAGAKR